VDDYGLCCKIWDRHLAKCPICSEEKETLCDSGTIFIEAAANESEEWFRGLLNKIGPEGKQMIKEELEKSLPDDLLDKLNKLPNTPTDSD